jgi:hypothetical protein
VYFVFGSKLRPCSSLTLLGRHVFFGEFVVNDIIDKFFTNFLEIIKIINKY